MVGIRGIEEGGGSYRRVVIGAALAGSMGLALYIGVKQYKRWKSERTSTSSQQDTDQSTPKEENKEKESDKPAEADDDEKPREKEPHKEPAKPSPEVKPSKPSVVVPGRSPSQKEKEKDEKQQPPKSPGTDASSESKDKPKKEEPKTQKPDPKNQAKEAEASKKAEEKPPKKDVESTKPEAAKPAADRDPVSSRPGEAVKTDTDIVVIEEPWQFQQPPEKTPKAEDVLEELVKPVRAVPETKVSAPSYAAVVAEKVEALVNASVEPASLGDDIEIIQDSLGDSGDFVKFDPEGNVIVQHETSVGKGIPPITVTQHEKEQGKTKDESKIPVPVKEDVKKVPTAQNPAKEESLKRDAKSGDQELRSSDKKVHKGQKESSKNKD